MLTIAKIWKYPSELRVSDGVGVPTLARSVADVNASGTTVGLIVSSGCTLVSQCFVTQMS